MGFFYLWIKHLFPHFNIIAMIILVYETIQSIVLFPVPPLNKTQLFGQLIPWSWNFTFVGTVNTIVLILFY
uniref:Transmembrane protein n=1 Tax=Medicago truncatula TaxID=3880 RepID=I3T5L7_MEDTR|nr:unknown [Medicago truncatula]